MLFRAALFDFDMTLIDSSDAMLRSFELLCSRFKKPPVTRERLMEVIGLHDEDFWRASVGGLTDEMLDYYVTECAPGEPARFRAMEGAAELLADLKNRGVKLALATNRGQVDDVLRATGLDRFLDCAVTSGMVSRPKPAPDILLRALELLGVGADEAVYVGDTDIDIRAGRAAGLPVVALTTSMSRERLAAFEPWKVCDSWAEVAKVLTA